MEKLKLLWARTRKFFNLTLLIKWVLISELLSSVILLKGNFYVPDYKDLRYEGYYGATIKDYAEPKYYVKRENTVFPVHRVRCIIDSDELVGLRKIVYAEAIDVLGTNSLALVKKCAKEETKVRGYLYTAEDGWYKYFYRSRHNDKEGLLRGDFLGKLEWYFYVAKEWRSVVYVAVGIVMLFLGWFKRAKEPFSHFPNNTSTPAKKNCANKTVSQEPEYTLLTKESYEKRYSADLRSVAGGLFFDEFCVSAKQTQAIQDFFFQKQTSDTIGDFVYPRLFGNSVLSDITSGYAAQPIYRIYRERFAEAEASLEPEPAEEPLLESSDGESESKLKGPIATGRATAREAMLIKVSPKIPFVKRRRVWLLERRKEGQFAEHRIKTDYFYAREIPGNYVMVTTHEKGIGIYEDVLKNEENPIMKGYEAFMKKIRLGRVGLFIQQSVLFLLSMVILLYAVGITVWWLFFPAAAVTITAAASFKYLVRMLGRKYVKKYGSIVYDGMFHKLWKIPYAILLALAFGSIAVKYLCFGFWG